MSWRDSGAFEESGCPGVLALASLAEGATIADIVVDFPTLSAEDVQAVIAFAAASAEEDLPVPPVPKVA